MRLRDRSTPVPRAQTDGLLTEAIGDEVVVYDLETKEAHCLKPVTAVVFANADGVTTLGQSAEIASRELGRAVGLDEVVAAVEQLEEVGLLEQPLIVIENGISRRQMVRRVAVTGAAAMTATTMITSIAAPTALAACTGQPQFCACSKNNQCSSGHCCGDVGNSGKCNGGCCADNNGNFCQCVTILGVLQCATLGVPAGACCTGVCVPVNAPC